MICGERREWRRGVEYERGEVGERMSRDDWWEGRV